jgi:hypothetical protein
LFSEKERLHSVIILKCGENGWGTEELVTQGDRNFSIDDQVVFMGRGHAFYRFFLGLCKRQGGISDSHLNVELVIIHGGMTSKL